MEHVDFGRGLFSARVLLFYADKLARFVSGQEMATALVGGHTESVLCVAGGTEGRLISGGEGGELCMWSLSGPVQQNKFTVPANEGQDGEETRDVTSICCSKLDPNLVSKIYRLNIKRSRI